jgi:hypothetical protein
MYRLVVDREELQSADRMPHVPRTGLDDLVQSRGGYLWFDEVVSCLFFPRKNVLRTEGCGPSFSDPHRHVQGL